MPDWFNAFSGFWWLLASLFPLLFLQKRLHREIISVFLLLTRRQNASLTIFSIFFFPGVLLHEMSHWLVARLLGVRTGRIWLIPELMPDGKLRMGYVETSRVDPLRDGLIGAAPLLLGGAFVAWAGLALLNLGLLWENLTAGEWGLFWNALSAIYERPDFWLWFYLLFVISSMMLPSETDRRAWLPIMVFVVVVLVLALFAGAGSWVLESLAPLANRAFNATAAVFGVSVLAHFVLWVPILLFRMLLNRITGLRVE